MEDDFSTKVRGRLCTHDLKVKEMTLITPMPFVNIVGLEFFFFQAEDGIRDDLVTGVQTCALPISEGRHAHRLGADEREARDEERANRDQDRQDPGEVAPREHPALEPPARAVEERGDAHGDQRADAEPEERPAAHREDRELQIERGDPVHDAVAEVRPRGLAESSLDRGHGRDGRNRPPHFARTSAKSSRVTTASPRPRAYASTALTTIPRAKDGIAWSRSRASASHASSHATGSPNVTVAG